MIPVMDINRLASPPSSGRVLVFKRSTAVESKRFNPFSDCSTAWALGFRCWPSLIAGLETSVLIDANGEIQIDWGSPGRVPLRPPVGMIAFRVWVHTHPDSKHIGAYRQKQPCNCGILSRALVLGAPGIKQSRNIGPENARPLAKKGHFNIGRRRVVAWDRWLEREVTPIEVVVTSNVRSPRDDEEKLKAHLAILRGQSKLKS